jgi:hypothetical protein
MKYHKLLAGFNVALTFLIAALLVNNAGAAPREKILYNFGPSKHVGVFPVASLIFDSSGNLYGTTSAGTHHHNCGFDGCGTVFKLSPKANGEWNETQLWSFDVSDGFNPTAALIFDADGNLIARPKKEEEAFKTSPTPTAVQPVTSSSCHLGRVVAGGRQYCIRSPPAEGTGVSQRLA